jgi:dTDP-4-dehydrorhamnose 3,5-epimerase
MNILPTKLPTLLLFEPKVFGDSRGFFTELYNQSRYETAGIDKPFIQDNLSGSSKNVIRGLHYQLKFPQGKLVSVIQGKVFDVVVDIRRGSPTFGHWESFELSDENHHQLYVPPGFAHGFCSLSEKVIFHYKCTDTYHPEDERGISWSDPDLNIAWPARDDALLSPKDALYLPLSQTPLEHLPEYSA